MHFQSITISMNVLYYNKEVYPQINKPFRCIDIYNRKTSVTLLVHPLMLSVQTPAPLCILPALFEVCSVTRCEDEQIYIHYAHAQCIH